MPPAAARRRRYRVYGLTLETDLPLPSLQPEEDGAAGLTSPGTGADLRLVLTTAPPVAGEPPPALFTSPAPSPFDPALPALTFHRRPGWDLLRFPGAADFHLGPDNLIHVDLQAPETLEAAETWFLGIVLAFWLERAGRPCLHAAAVAADGEAVALLAFSGSGKSTLAAGLLQAGHGLLTDDVLPLAATPDGFRAQPSYPQMRLWPASAGRFVESAEDLPQVHPQIDKRRLPPEVLQGAGYAFHSEPCPLTRLYLPDRRPPQDLDSHRIRIEPVRPRDAVIELVRHSFLPRLCEAAGWQERRLDFFARLAREIPVKRLSYPEGYEHLPRVREALLADMRAT